MIACTELIAVIVLNVFDFSRIMRIEKLSTVRYSPSGFRYRGARSRLHGGGLRGAAHETNKNNREQDYE